MFATGENLTNEQCSDSNITPLKPSSRENKTVEDANFALEVKDLKDDKFQIVNESRLN